MERRNFLKYCAATGVGSSFIFNPLSSFANDALKRKKVKFKLSKPRWVIYDNGSYDLISDEIILKNCRPAIDGQGVMPKNVFLGDSPKGKRIVYELPGGFLMLDLKTNKDSISIGAEFSGFSKAPRWFYPISQAEIFGVDQFFKQGFGTDGPSGVFTAEEMQSDSKQNWTQDSYMTFGFLGKQETIAVGNIDHNNFQQRFTIYNRSHSGGLRHEKNISNQIFFESGMLLDEIQIDNEYIKLPDLHFYTGNSPLETFQSLAWKTAETTFARQDSKTSYHWLTPSQKVTSDCYRQLRSQLELAKHKNLFLHSFCIKNYCIEGDWLEPDKSWTGGLDNAAREIYREGFRAGIAISPFRVSDKSRVFKNHKDWIIKDKYNTINPEEQSEDENFYALDLSHPGVQKYIVKVFRTFRKFGFIFYETSFMNYGFKDSLKVTRKISGKSNVQIFREVCALIRTEIGPGSLWMVNDTPFAPIIGFADIVKINSSFYSNANKQEANNLIRESWSSHYFNNIYWQNSIGELKLSKSTSGEKSFILGLMRWIAILGGAVGTTDNLAEWDEELIKDFKFLEPSQRPQNAYLPFWPDKEKIKVAVRIYKTGRSCGLLFFNNTNHPLKQSFQIFDLFEQEDAFVFNWGDSVTALGKRRQISVSLKPGASELFYLSERNQEPDPALTISGEMSNEKKEILLKEE